MTEVYARKEKNTKKEWLPTLVCLLLAALMILMSNQLRKGVYRGISLCISSLIPTLFPFFILSDIWSAHFRLNKESILGKAFEKTFYISGEGATAFLCGIVCGFPLGVKVASDLYKRESLTKEEFQNLCGFINNPSAAFVISGIGLGIYRNVSIGIILYISVVLSAVFLGLLFRKKSVRPTKTEFITGQTFSLVKSVRSAGYSSVTVASYVIFFSGILSVASFIIPYSLPSAIFHALIEVSSAVEFIASVPFSSNWVKLGLTAFALGFSGLSVHLQAFSFMPKELSRKKYLLMKLIQGLLCAVITVLLYSVLH